MIYGTIWNLLQLMFWQVVPDQSPEVTSAVALIVAVATAVGSLLQLWWAKGSPARIAEMQAARALEDASAKRVEDSYKQKIAEIIRERGDDLAQQTLRIDALEKHVRECDEKYERALIDAAHAKGMMEVLERAGAKVEQKVDNIVAKAADSGINLTGQ